jgi:AraC-like DNA-binding protein
VVHVTGEHGKLLPWAEHLLQLLQEEAARGPARAQLLIDRLFSVLLAKALRENSPLAGRRELGHQQQREDEEVQDALARIHARPDFPWTVARLADEVGLSRSGFAARFSQRVGRPPWEYLRDLRMELASQLLREGGHGLKEIAVRTGYKTASAISTAFKRWAGVSPLEYRRAPITSRQPSAHEASSQ